MIKKLLRYIQGFLLIELKGNGLELLVNQLMRTGINLWGVERLSRGHFRARIRAADFKRLRPTARRRMSRIRIIKRRGLPFILRQAGRRYLLVIGLLFFFLIFYLGSSFLWFIEIAGLDKLDRGEIAGVLRDYGVKPGMLKKSIDLGELDRHLQLTIPGIVWVDSRWQGTRLIVEIVEKRIVEKTRPGNVYAARDGLISQIIVLKGQAAVREGDTVTAGQPLIVALNPGEKARGVVRAHVWYEEESEYSLSQQGIAYTGRHKTRWGIRGREGIFWLGPADPPFENYRRVQEIKTVLKWRNIAFPLELIKEEYQEISCREEVVSRETARFLAREEALAGIFKKMTPGAVIKEIRTELRDTGGPELVRLRVLVKVEEDIAKEGAGDSS